ncbi:MAG: hypothetical protein LBM04_09965, partial [Opitutaceae bacterium]|nr:hypothetical protein [Opitutaceae bacterium]
TNDTEYNDARYLPTKATDALGYDITFSYDEDGRQISMTNRRGNTYTTTYDDANRKVMTATPEGRETTVFANARDLPETTIRPSDKTVKNTSFDAEGRVLTQVIYSDTSQTTILASSTMSYDAAGRLYQVKENGKTTTRTYDSLGRLASYSDGEGHTMSYGYDAANNLTTLTYPGNLTVTYTYDANNRLESVTDWDNRTTTHTYDAVGRLRKTERPNGTIRNQVYDAAGQLRFIEERSATDVLLWMRALEYDADGRITKTHTWPSNTASSYTAPNASDSATYDDDNRIAQWSLGSGGSVNAVFDDDGNMTHGPAVNNPNSTGLGYQYDAHNRLTGVGGQANLYRYNPEGHRVEAGGVAYVIDPNAGLSRTLMRVDGSTTTYYIWGANGLEYEITGASTKTYHPDHLGSTMLLTNDNGQPTGDYYEYDSYGTPTYRTGTANTPFQWHGTLGVTTEANGLVHMRARFYHPRIMRFVNEDPIGFQGGMNLFAFVNGDPMSGVDPAGLCRYDWNSNTIAPTSLIPTNTGGTQLPRGALANGYSVLRVSEPADLPGGQIAAKMGIYHQWIAVYKDGKLVTAAGLGNQEGVPGENGQRSPDSPYASHGYVVDHAHRMSNPGIITKPVYYIDPVAALSYITDSNIGRDQGSWIFQKNDCNTWVDSVIINSTPQLREMSQIRDDNGMYIPSYRAYVYPADGTMREPNVLTSPSGDISYGNLFQR